MQRSNKRAWHKDPSTTRHTVVGMKLAKIERVPGHESNKRSRRAMNDDPTRPQIANAKGQGLTVVRTKAKWNRMESIGMNEPLSQNL